MLNASFFELSLGAKCSKIVASSSFALFLSALHPPIPIITQLEPEAEDCSRLVSFRKACTVIVLDLSLSPI